MCKSKPQPQVTTQSTKMDPFVTEAQQNLLRTGQQVLQPYMNAGPQGFGVAGFTPDETNAHIATRDIAGTMIGAPDRGGLDPTGYRSFLNPYTQDVVNTTADTMRRESDRTLNQIRARTAAGSSFGGSGSRGALLEAREREGLGERIATTTAQLMAQGYDKATATAMASEELDRLGDQQRLNNELRAVGMLSASGEAQRELEQRRLDTPLRGLEAMRAITPQQYNSTQTTTAPPPPTPSPLQQILGLGASVMGMSAGGPAGATVAGSLFNRLFNPVGRVPQG